MDDEKTHAFDWASLMVFFGWEDFYETAALPLSYTGLSCLLCVVYVL